MHSTHDTWHSWQAAIVVVVVVATAAACVSLCPKSFVSPCGSVYYRSAMIIIIVVVVVVVDSGLACYFYYIMLQNSNNKGRILFASTNPWLPSRTPAPLILFMCCQRLRFLHCLSCAVHYMILLCSPAFAASCRKCGCAFVLLLVTFCLACGKFHSPVPVGLAVPEYLVPTGCSSSGNSSSGGGGGNTHALMSKNHLRRCYL